MSLAWMIAFLAWPLIEIAVLIKAGGWLGFLPTLAIVVGTGILGTAVLMRYGVDQAVKVQEAMMRGDAPLLAMMDGALVALAGILLIVPGLCADTVGLVLLMPPVRALAARWLMRTVLGVSEADIRGTPGARFDRDPRRGEPQPRDGPIIEGEFERIDERTVPPDRQREPPRRGE
jgi:UPF0716 protein FxsA